MVLRLVGRFLHGSIGKSEAQQWYDHGVGLQRRGQLDEAVQAYTEAIRFDPGLVQAYNNRGAANINLGKPELAIPDLDEAIKLRPNLAVAHSTRGMAHTSLGQLDRAVRDLNEAIRLNPKFADAYSGRGIAPDGTRLASTTLPRLFGSTRVLPSPTTTGPTLTWRWARSTRRYSIWNKRSS